MQIEVKSCGGCPFIIEDPAWDTCGIDNEIHTFMLPRNQIHENCPLKKESVTVKLKEE